jgi:hypothetical protein
MLLPLSLLDLSCAVCHTAVLAAASLCAVCCFAKFQHDSLCQALNAVMFKMLRHSWFLLDTITGQHNHWDIAGVAL